MTTLKIQDEANIQSEGKKRNRNAKPVFCIETGEVYNSVADAAEANGVFPQNMGAHLRGARPHIHKKHFAFVSKANENLGSIMTHIRVTSEKYAELEFKAKAYDAIMAEQHAKEKKQQRLDILIDKREKANERIMRDTKRVADIDAEIKSLQEELSA